MLECYKTTHGLNGFNCNDYFEFNCYGKTRTNHSFKLRQPLARVNCFLHSFFIRIIKKWNTLPEEIVHEQNFSTFNIQSIMKFCKFFTHFLISLKFYIVLYFLLGTSLMTFPCMYPYIIKYLNYTSSRLSLG